MKRISILLFISTLLLSISAKSQEANFKVFPFKTGIIEYKQEGNAKGTHIKYIDEYGYKQADFTETETTVFGFTNKENKGVIMVGSKIYIIDFSTNTASTGVSPVYDTYANSDGADYDEIGKKSMAALGFSNSGKTETIAGKKCEVWQGSLGKIWVWKSLALKSQTTVLGINITEIATSVKINAHISQSKFEVPENIEVEEIPMMDNTDGMKGVNEIYSNDDAGFSQEDKDYVKKINSMSYSEFRQMVMKEEPGMSEEEIKLAYKMSKEMAKYVK